MIENLTNNVCSLPAHYHFVLILLVAISQMLIEAWLGKTTRVQSASILELVFRTIKWVYTRGGNNV